MSNTARSIKMDGDDQRLKAWRFERQKVAEIERHRRLAEQEKQKQIAAKKSDSEKKALAKKLKPSSGEIEDFKTAINTQSRRARFRFIVQLTGLVFLPLIAVTWYLFVIATPLFKTSTTMFFDSQSETQSENQGLLSTRPKADLQLAFAAKAFIESNAMFEILVSKYDVLNYFSDNRFDYLQRIKSIPGLDLTTLGQFQRFVQSSVDIQTGFLTIAVKSDDPEFSQKLALQIVTALENRVNANDQARTDQIISEAELALSNAEENLRLARSDLDTLQTDFGVSDPTSELDRTQTKIKNLEEEISELDLAITRSEIAGRTGSFQVHDDRALRAELLKQIEVYKNSLVFGNPSLTEIFSKFQNAELDIQLAERELESAYAALSEARSIAVLSKTSVSIVSPTYTTDIPVYPNKLGTLSVIFGILVAIFFFGRMTIFRSQPNLH